MDEFILFYDPTSEPCRSVLWVIKELQINVKIQPTWLGRGDHLTKDYEIINPQKEVPALAHKRKDNSVIYLSESQAICIYLSNFTPNIQLKYKLFGEDIYTQSKINQWMCWNQTNVRLHGTLNYCYPMFISPFYMGKTQPDGNQVNLLRSKLRESLFKLEMHFENNNCQYIIGNHLTAADILISSELFALYVDPQLDLLFEGRPKVKEWLTLLQSLEHCQSTTNFWFSKIPEIQTKINNKDGSLFDSTLWINEYQSKLDLYNPF